MAMHIHPAISAALPEPQTDTAAALYPNWGARLVTAVAITMGVLVVALIAIVMGMA